jgi:2-amino-4-hydroxy-6-hydroxymethyldihydropteridine diphosphokinase
MIARDGTSARARVVPGDPPAIPRRPRSPREVLEAPVRVAIGLGSSLGDRRATLERTLVRLDATPGLQLVRASRWVRTPPLRGGTATGWFLNGVAVFAATLDPHAILDVCRALETAEGRRRTRFWGDRTLDLDLLLVDGVVVRDERLTVPHPALHLRPFVLGPLLEVWPDAVDAGTGRRLAETPRPKGPLPVHAGVVARASRAVTLDGPRPQPRSEP